MKNEFSILSPSDDRSIMYINFIKSRVNKD